MYREHKKVENHYFSRLECVVYVLSFFKFVTVVRITQ